MLMRLKLTKMIRNMKQCILNFNIILLWTVLHYTHGRFYHEKQDDLIYILQWTQSKTGPFPSMESGQDAFIFRNCPHTNCYITNDTGYLKNIKYFDALLINVVDMHKDPLYSLPPKRAAYQKYIFVSRESYVNYPVDETYDGYFNWTWTHRLDSDIRYEYIAIRDQQGKLIGPKHEMHWIDIVDMKPITKYLKRKLKKKKYAAAWFVSNCEAKNNRLGFAEKLEKELKKYGQVLHIYGSCGEMKCPMDGLWEGCFALIEQDYYFYLAFENAHSVDYVSEKLLNALNHFAVPVVYGGANYTKFMPDGIYLDADVLGIEKLAREMDRIIKDKNSYYDFFRWHNHYSFFDTNDSPETDGICDLCAKLNNYTLRTTVSVHTNLSAWWNEAKIEDATDLRTVPVPVTTAPVEYKNLNVVMETTKQTMKPANTRAYYVSLFLSKINDFFFGPLSNSKIPKV